MFKHNTNYSPRASLPYINLITPTQPLTAMASCEHRIAKSKLKT